MAVQAQWHDRTWHISESGIIPLGEIKFKRAISIEESKDSEGQPPCQIVRMENDQMTVHFDLTKMTSSTDPRNVFDQWYSLCGIHAPFYLNGWQLGETDMLLLDVDTTFEIYSPKGLTLVNGFDCTFEGWFEEGGKKSDKSRWASLTPGVSEYKGDEVESALRVTASPSVRARGERG